MRPKVFVKDVGIEEAQRARESIFLVSSQFHEELALSLSDEDDGWGDEDVLEF